MRVYDVGEAKIHLSRLVEEAAEGESFVISKDGKPLVRVVPIEAGSASKSRIGFMKGEITVPDDFDRMGENGIDSMFGLNSVL